MMADVNPTFDDLTMQQIVAIGSMEYLHAALVEDSEKEFYRFYYNLGDVRDETLEITCGTLKVRVRIQIEVVED